MENYAWEYAFDKPVKYKTLTLHPVRMRDYMLFTQVASILLIDKNSIADVEIISMSYLKYLFYLRSEPVRQILLRLLKLVLLPEVGDEEDVEISLIPVMESFMVEGEIFDSQDFENIRSIILEQNGLKPPDENIQKKLRDRMEEDAAFRRRLSGNKTASLEDQMVATSAQTGISLENIYGMTVRKFMKLVERVDHTMHYQIYMSASLSGFVTFKNKSAIKHWLADLSKDKLDGLMTEETFESNLKGAI